MCRVGVILGEGIRVYGFPNHPFRRERYDAFLKRLKELGLDREIDALEPEMARPDDLSLFHTEDYIEFVKRASKLGHGYLDYGDTPAFKGVYEASSYVVGSTIKGLRLVIEGGIHVFNPIAGLHHAKRGSAAGFCVFNDVGVAIEKARRMGISKIGYIDIDAHHGDGVYYEFIDDPSLYIADIHEDGRYIYPGTGFSYERGAGRAEGTKLNIPLPPYAGDEEFIDALTKIEEFFDRFEPELFILQCGADGLSGDPLTHLRYSERAHREASRLCHRLAHRHAEGRLLALGGGGYDLDNLANAWCEVVKILLEPAPG